MLSLTFFPKSLTNHPAIEAEDAVAFLKTARGANVGTYYFLGKLLHCLGRKSKYQHLLLGKDEKT